MNVPKAVTTALRMLSVQIFLEDTVVNVTQDLKEMERLVHVSYPFNLKIIDTQIDLLCQCSSYVYNCDHSCSLQGGNHWN